MKLFLLLIISVISIFAFVSLIKKQSLESQLIIASENGNIQKIKKLLSSGVNVNSKEHFSPDAGTPLIWAVRCEQEKAVKILLAAGADPNITCGTGETALFFAIGGSTNDASSIIIKELILAGANTEKEKFESLPVDDPNRIAFEKAIKLRKGVSQ